LGAAAILIFVFGRSAHVRVPVVVGRDQATAARLVEAAGLRPRVEHVQSTVPAGLVVAEVPRPGKRVTKHAIVTLRLSSGPGMTSIPAVLRERPAQAEQALAQAALTYTLTRQHSATVAAGLVTGSLPSPFSQVSRGTRVTLIVSSGPAQASTPKVVGSAEAAAQATLTRAGFQVVIVREQSAGTAGTVTSQDPAAGTRVKRGTSARIVVAVAPPQVTLPDVTGDDLESAVTSLSRVGVTIEFTNRALRKGETADKVVSQQPSGGSTVAGGSTVTLTVTRS
jgi:serine/threonine-protein kinase